MKVLTVAGARPQFIKAFAVSRQLRENHDEVLVHTGQHYDDMLSDVFFENLDMPRPDYNLGVGSASHGVQTAEMLVGIEELINSESPDVVLLYGDTNSTLAGALAGSKMDPAVVHVEAGLRSHNWEMPEEINRVLTDHASDVLCAPSELAVKKLQDEGRGADMFNTGDVMYDALLAVRDSFDGEPEILSEIGLDEREYILSTVHRVANTDNRNRLRSIIQALGDAPLPVVLPLHPRTEHYLKEYGLWEDATETLHIVDPLEYVTFLQVLDKSKIIATDSGSVQKEAFFLDTYCVTIRDETEWVETVEAGYNELVGADYDAITTALASEPELPSEKPTPYGDGNAAREITRVLETTVGE